MTPLVADASVVCKLYFDEENSALAKQFANRAELALSAPDLLLTEVGNGVFRRVRDGVMSRAEGDIAVSDLRHRFPRTVPVSKLFDAAWKISMALRHPVSDCVYLALAFRRGGLMVTADGRFLSKVSQSRWREFAASLRDAAAQ